MSYERLYGDLTSEEVVAQVQKYTHPGLTIKDGPTCLADVLEGPTRRGCNLSRKDSVKLHNFLRR